MGAGRWKSRSTELPGGRSIHFVVESDQGRLSVADAVAGWRDEPAFREFFSCILESVRFEAFRWETPPATDKTASRDLEFVVIDSPGLSVAADWSAFAEHLKAGTADVTTFQNLGRDATLVVPQPVKADSDYSHFGRFIRTAPDHQKQALWKAVGEAMALRINRKPVWLSTAGAGVPWLHVRLDDRPKYYSHRPYREFSK
jgi:hypothetical protein